MLGFEDILWRPYFPPLPTLAAAGVLVVLAGVSYARAAGASPARAAGPAVLRLSAVAVVTLILMGPSAEPEPVATGGKPGLTLMVDTSGSMRTADVDGRPRLAFVAERWLDPGLLERLERRFDVGVVAFDDAPRHTPVGTLRRDPAEVAAARVTNLASSVERTLSRLPGGDGSAVMVLSDGHDSQGRSLAAAAELGRAKSLPVFASVIGSPTLQRDVAVRATGAQPFLLAGETGAVSVEVTHANAAGAGSTLRVTLPGGGSSGGEGEGERVAEREVRFSPKATQRLSLPITHDEPGVYEYEVAVDPIEGEVEPANNRQRVFVEVIDQRLKVLLLEGQPFWDTKFLAQSLRKDDRIELTQLSQVTPSRREQLLTRAESGGVPASLEDLARYDVVILGRVIERVLPAEAWDALAAYVGEHGGRLVLARGQPYDPDTAEGRRLSRLLAPLEPVVWGVGGRSEQRLVLTPSGRSHPVFAGEGLAMLEDAPPMTWAPDVTRAKAAAQVLVRTTSHAGAAMAGGGQPIIAAMHYDRGQVLAVLGEGLWRWRLAGRGDPTVEAAYDRFWSGMVRYLAMGSRYRPGQDLALKLGRRNTQIHQPIHGELTDRNPARAAPPTITVIDPEGHRSALQPRGRPGSTMRFTFAPDRVGVYRVVAADPGDPEAEPVEARVNAVDLDTERLRASADPMALRGLAAGSGGRLLDPRQPEAVLAALDDHVAAMTTTGPPRYLWDRAWLLVLLGGLLGVEWIVRKAGGLL